MDEADAPPRLWRGDGTDQTGIAPAARPASLAGASVRVWGLGPCGSAAALAAAQAGAATVSLVGTPERPAAPVARRIAALAPGTGIQLDPDRKVDGQIAVAYGAVAPPLHHRLVLAGPHVAVLVDEAGASVLPVRPGTAACVRCHGLGRADRDPAWPVLARQCEAIDERADSITATVTGALAVAALAVLLEGRTAPGWRIVSGRPRRLRVPPHPACGCGAA